MNDVRDYFAGLAMQALIERAGDDSVESAATASAKIATTAYDIAGAMVAERALRIQRRERDAGDPPSIVMHTPSYLATTGGKYCTTCKLADSIWGRSCPGRPAMGG
jgi:hypothetical protein